MVGPHHLPVELDNRSLAMVELAQYPNLVMQAEWRRSARWHTDASTSSGFERHEREYPHTVENSEKLARYAARHRPFYEQLYAQRMDVSPWKHMPGS